MSRIVNYFRESYEELSTKVTWPSWSIVQESTVAVVIATVIITLCILLMDLVSTRVLDLIYEL